MIKNSLVKYTVYISLLVQIIITILAFDSFNYTLKPGDKILKDSLILETVVQVVEACFYIWVIFALTDLKKMTPRRYIDWFITTPTMILSTIIFMQYIRDKNENENENENEPLNFWKFLKDHKNNIIKLGFYNFMMLLIGFLGEIGVIWNKFAVFIGFGFFYLIFENIYNNYAKFTEIGRNLFYFMSISWGLYGVAALMNITTKNTMYNLLDIVSKNFYGLFLYYYISKVGKKI